MATEIRMPRLGWTMEEGTFGEWLKQDGESIKAGDFLFTVEGDKATQEVEAFDSGILRLPPNAAVRFEVRDNGSGSVSVAPALTRQSGGGGSDSGVWETSGFASAAHKITILVNNVGSGSISLR